MMRPPLWAWALPAAVAVGLLVGVRLRPASPPAAAAPPVAQPPSLVPATDTTVGRPSAPDFASAPSVEVLEWGLDGGEYRGLDGASVAGDTFPAAPAVTEADGSGGPGVAEAAPGPLAVRDLHQPLGGPAQRLTRLEAFARPLVAAVRGGGRLSFYSVWAAPASRASLVGEWSRVGRCADPAVRLGYEQAIAGLGAVRGAGQAAETPEWEVALVVPRQQCASAAQRWRPARVPEPDLSALLGPLLDGEPPRSVVVDGDRVWAASVGRAVTARLVAGQPVETWSAEAPPGSSMRLLGRWEGDGVWVAVGSGGRVVRIWRGGGSG